MLKDQGLYTLDETNGGKYDEEPQDYQWYSLQRLLTLIDCGVAELSLAESLGDSFTQEGAGGEESGKVPPRTAGWVPQQAESITVDLRTGVRGVVAVPSTNNGWVQEYGVHHLTDAARAAKRGCTGHAAHDVWVRESPHHGVGISEGLYGPVLQYRAHLGSHPTRGQQLRARAAAIDRTSWLPEPEAAKRQDPDLLPAGLLLPGAAASAGWVLPEASKLPLSARALKFSPANLADLTNNADQFWARITGLTTAITKIKKIRERVQSSPAALLRRRQIRARRDLFTMGGADWGDQGLWEPRQESWRAETEEARKRQTSEERELDRLLGEVVALWESVSTHLRSCRKLMNETYPLPPPSVEAQETGDFRLLIESLGGCDRTLRHMRLAATVSQLRSLLTAGKGRYGKSVEHQLKLMEMKLEEVVAFTGEETLIVAEEQLKSRLQLLQERHLLSGDIIKTLANRSVFKDTGLRGLRAFDPSKMSPMDAVPTPSSAQARGTSKTTSGEQTPPDDVARLRSQFAQKGKAKSFAEPARMKAAGQIARATTFDSAVDGHIKADSDDGEKEEPNITPESLRLRGEQLAERFTREKAMWGTAWCRQPQLLARRLENRRLLLKSNLATTHAEVHQLRQAIADTLHHAGGYEYQRDAAIILYQELKVKLAQMKIRRGLFIDHKNSRRICVIRVMRHKMLKTGAEDELQKRVAAWRAEAAHRKEQQKEEQEAHEPAPKHGGKEKEKKKKEKVEADPLMDLKKPLHTRWCELRRQQLRHLELRTKKLKEQKLDRRLLDDLATAAAGCSEVLESSLAGVDDVLDEVSSCLQRDQSRMGALKEDPVMDQVALTALGKLEVTIRAAREVVNEELRLLKLLRANDGPVTIIGLAPEGIEALAEQVPALWPSQPLVFKDDMSTEARRQSMMGIEVRRHEVVTSLQEQVRKITVAGRATGNLAQRWLELQGQRAKLDGEAQKIRDVITKQRKKLVERELIRLNGAPAGRSGTAGPSESSWLAGKNKRRALAYEKAVMEYITPLEKRIADLGVEDLRKLLSKESDKSAALLGELLTMQRQEERLQRLKETLQMEADQWNRDNGVIAEDGPRDSVSVDAIASELLAKMGLAAKEAEQEAAMFRRKSDRLESYTKDLQNLLVDAPIIFGGLDEEIDPKEVVDEAEKVFHEILADQENGKVRRNSLAGIRTSLVRDHHNEFILPEIMDELPAPQKKPAAKPKKQATGHHAKAKASSSGHGHGQGTVRHRKLGKNAGQQGGHVPAGRKGVAVHVQDAVMPVPQQDTSVADHEPEPDAADSLWASLQVTSSDALDGTRQSNSDLEERSFMNDTSFTSEMPGLMPDEVDIGEEQSTLLFQDGDEELLRVLLETRKVLGLENDNIPIPAVHSSTPPPAPPPAQPAKGRHDRPPSGHAHAAPHGQTDRPPSPNPVAASHGRHERRPSLSSQTAPGRKKSVTGDSIKGDTPEPGKQGADPRATDTARIAAQWTAKLGGRPPPARPKRSTGGRVQSKESTSGKDSPVPSTLSRPPSQPHVSESDVYKAARDRARTAAAQADRSRGRVAQLCRRLAQVQALLRGLMSRVEMEESLVGSTGMSAPELQGLLGQGQMWVVEYTQNAFASESRQLERELKDMDEEVDDIVAQIVELRDMCLAAEPGREEGGAPSPGLRRRPVPGEISVGGDDEDTEILDMDFKGSGSGSSRHHRGLLVPSSGSFIGRPGSPSRGSPTDMYIRGKLVSQQGSWRSMSRQNTPGYGERVGLEVLLKSAGAAVKKIEGPPTFRKAALVTMAALRAHKNANAEPLTEGVVAVGSGKIRTLHQAALQAWHFRGDEDASIKEWMERIDKAAEGEGLSDSSAGEPATGEAGEGEPLVRRRGKHRTAFYNEFKNKDDDEKETDKDYALKRRVQRLQAFRLARRVSFARKKEQAEKLAEQRRQREEALAQAFARDGGWREFEEFLLEIPKWDEAPAVHTKPELDIQYGRGQAALLFRKHMALLKSAQPSSASQQLARVLAGWQESLDGRRAGAEKDLLWLIEHLDEILASLRREVPHLVPRGRPSAPWRKHLRGLLGQPEDEPAALESFPALKLLLLRSAQVRCVTRQARKRKRAYEKDHAAQPRSGSTEAGPLEPDQRPARWRPRARTFVKALTASSLGGDDDELKEGPPTALGRAEESWAALMTADAEPQADAAEEGTKGSEQLQERSRKSSGSFADEAAPKHQAQPVRRLVGPDTELPPLTSRVSLLSDMPSLAFGEGESGYHYGDYAREPVPEYTGNRKIGRPLAFEEGSPVHPQNAGRYPWRRRYPPFEDFTRMRVDGEDEPLVRVVSEVEGLFSIIRKALVAQEAEVGNLLHFVHSATKRWAESRRKTALGRKGTIAFGRRGTSIFAEADSPGELAEAPGSDRHLEAWPSLRGHKRTVVQRPRTPSEGAVDFSDIADWVGQFRVSGAFSLCHEGGGGLAQPARRSSGGQASRKRRLSQEAGGSVGFRFLVTVDEQDLLEAEDELPSIDTVSDAAAPPAEALAAAPDAAPAVAPAQQPAPAPAQRSAGIPEAFTQGPPVAHTTWEAPLSVVGIAGVPPPSVAAGSATPKVAQKAQESGARRSALAGATPSSTGPSGASLGPPSTKHVRVTSVTSVDVTDVPLDLGITSRPRRPGSPIMTSPGGFCFRYDAERGWHTAQGARSLQMAAEGQQNAALARPTSRGSSTMPPLAARESPSPALKGFDMSGSFGGSIGSSSTRCPGSASPTSPFSFKGSSPGATSPLPGLGSTAAEALAVGRPHTAEPPASRTSPVPFSRATSSLGHRKVLPHYGPFSMTAPTPSTSSGLPEPSGSREGGDTVRSPSPPVLPPRATTPGPASAKPGPAGAVPKARSAAAPSPPPSAQPPRQLAEEASPATAALRQPTAQPAPGMELALPTPRGVAPADGQRGATPAARAPRSALKEASAKRGTVLLVETLREPEMKLDLQLLDDLTPRPSQIVASPRPLTGPASGGGTPASSASPCLSAARRALRAADAAAAFAAARAGNDGGGPGPAGQPPGGHQGAPAGDLGAQSIRSSQDYDLPSLRSLLTAIDSPQDAAKKARGGPGAALPTAAVLAAAGGQRKQPLLPLPTRLELGQAAPGPFAAPVATSRGGTASPAKSVSPVKARALGALLRK